MSQIAAGLGLGLGTIGSILGAGSTNRAGRQARDWYNQRTLEGRAQLLNSLFGNRYNVNYGQNTLGFGSPGDNAAAASIPGLPRGGLNQFNQRTLRRGLRMYDRAGRGFEQDAGRLGQMSALQTLFADRAGSNLDRLAAGGEDIARGYGRGANALIDQETQRALQGANAISQARLNATGLGNSTLVSNALSGNAVQAGLGASRQKLDVQRDMTDRLLGARSNRIAAGQQSANRSVGARRDALDTERSLAAARTGLGTGRAGLFMDQRNRNSGVIQSALMSSQNNPWLGQSTSQFYPGASSVGSALASAGTGLAGLAGSGLFDSPAAGGSGQMSPEMMTLLQQLFAGAP